MTNPASAPEHKDGAAIILPASHAGVEKKDEAVKTPPANSNDKK